MSHDTLTVYAIYDSKSESWSRPVYSRNDATCQREVRDVLANGQTPYSLHPEDYGLYRLGTWSEFKPFFEYDQQPELVNMLVQLMPKRTEYTHLQDAPLSAA